MQRQCGLAFLGFRRLVETSPDTNFFLQVRISAFQKAEKSLVTSITSYADYCCRVVLLLGFESSRVEFENEEIRLS